MLNDFEKSLMNRLLAGDDSTLALLRNQYKAATTIKRELTGVGEFVNFSFPQDIIRIEKPRNLEITDVAVELESVAYGGLSVILFVRDGIIDFLEVVVNGNEAWPQNFNNVSISYIHPKYPGSMENGLSDKRDFLYMKRNWKI
jgi:hypothetical protein